MSEEELLSLKQAAERYHIPIPTLRAAVQRGAISGRKIGSQWVVDARSVEVFRNNPPRPGRPAKRGKVIDK